MLLSMALGSSPVTTSLTCLREFAPSGFPPCVKRPVWMTAPRGRRGKRDSLYHSFWRFLASAATVAPQTCPQHSAFVHSVNTSSSTLTPLGIRQDQLPRHIAVIMDGNSRWAKEMGADWMSGHRTGVTSLRETMRCCQAWSIKCLTVYAFSAENWQRSEVEVSALLSLIRTVIEQELQELMDTNTKVLFLGDRTALPAALQAAMSRCEEATALNHGLQVMVALSYGARQDITRAVADIVTLVAAGRLLPTEVSDKLVARHLSTGVVAPDLQCPDLVIRTGGEQRQSNFLLWESAYSELYFTQKRWPAFDQAELRAAIHHYASRQRRFGKRL